jgi:polar amino acid transport system substrate-binding protein
MLSRRHLLTLAGAGVVVAGCGPDRRPTLTRLRETGTARVGIAGEQPFGYLDPWGTLTGVSPEVARVVLRSIGVTILEPVQRPFAQLIPTLLAGTFDIITAGMAITPGRCLQVAFSNPDFLAPTALLVPKGSPRGLRTFHDVARAGVPIAVQESSIEQDTARAAGIPDTRIQTYPSASQLYEAVAEGQAPVGALTDISLRATLRRHPGSPLEVTAGLPTPARTTPPVGAFAFRPADTELRDVVNAGLAGLHASPEWAQLVTPFGVTEANLPPPTLTAAQLCGEPS